MTTVDRDLLDRYPAPIRKAYRRVLGEFEPQARHQSVVQLAETGLEIVASYSFSAYRNQSWREPHPSIEGVLTGGAFTFGKYIELLRATLRQSQHPILAFDTQPLPECGRLALAMETIKEAIDVGASNLGRMLEKGMERRVPKVDWMKGSELLVEYRNKSTGHARDHGWPTSDLSYYRLMTPIAEAAVVELLSRPPVREMLSSYVVGTLRSTHLLPERFEYVFQGDQDGVPVQMTATLDQSESTMFPESAWSGASTSGYLLSVGSEGTYTLVGLYHDLRRPSFPAPLVIRREPPAAPAAVAPSALSAHEGKASAAGTCGELVQGFLSDGTNFHVTCPINKTSTVTVRMVPAERWTFRDTEFTKLREAVRRAAALATPGAFDVEVGHYTDLDVGKGMGSSTADIVAATRAVGAALGFVPTEEQQATIATQIESSDGSMYPGLVAFQHRAGELVERFSWWPRFAIAMMVPQETVDTESADFTGKDGLGPHYDEILASLREAADLRQGRPFAEAATRSAELNQPFLPNPYFDLVEALMHECGADGINVGHTGTVCGLLYLMPPLGDPTSAAVLGRARTAVQRLAASTPSASAHLVMTPPSPV